MAKILKVNFYRKRLNFEASNLVEKICNMSSIDFYNQYWWQFQ